jgi:transposase
MENDKPLAPSKKTQVRCKPINRQQFVCRPVDVEKLIEPGHPARAIWELTAKTDLTPFYADLKAVEGVAGRPPWDPQLLASLWIYAYKEGINSAREITELCTYHPAYQWLTGLQAVNHHTLADFRTAHKEALDELFIEILGVLSHERLITLERVTQDGMKVKACASDRSFHRKATLEDHLRLAQEQVKQMGDPDSEEVSQRVAKARERAARKKQERLEKALKTLEQMQTVRTKASVEEQDQEKRKQVRVSSTDPEARVMLQGKGGYAPSYNTQISTDAKAKVIVAVGVSQSANDGGELLPAVERIEANLGEKPKQIVADGAYPTQGNIEAMDKEGIDLIGPMPERKKAGWDPLKRRGVSPEFYPQAFSYDSSTDQYTCPGSKVLVFETEEKQGGWMRRRYRARRSDCRACPFQGQCCPETQKGRSLVRMQPSPELVAFQAKMETAEAKQIYKQRAEVAEFPHAWIKDKFGLRQFRLRGLAKVTMEALWACLTYNVCLWIRLCWKPRQLAQA